MVSVFMSFIFSALGLSVLYFSQIYLKWSAYKKNAMLLNYASENGIKQGVNMLAEKLSQTPVPFLLTNEETVTLLEDTQNNGTKIVEKLLQTPLPLSCSGHWERLDWESFIQFFKESLIEKQNYFAACYKAQIEASSKLEHFKPERTTRLEGLIDILAGNIPLPALPILIGKDLSEDQKKKFLNKNDIEWSSSEPGFISVDPVISSSDLLPEKASPLAAKALKIEMFSTDDLSIPQIRKALGLEISNDTIPEGVYLIRNDMGLGGIYVQGDVNEMVLAIDEDDQVISFATDWGHWVLRFNPSVGKTSFVTPEELQFFDSVPLGIIIIEGTVHSLGGGIIDPSGKPLMIKDSEIPCIRRGVNLTIVCSDKITLSSHLIHQGVRWTEGIPYVEDASSQLNIFATGTSVTGDNAGEGKIIVEKDSPQEVLIQASLTASEKGFSIEGKNKDVRLFGSIHFKNYKANGNQLNVHLDKRFLTNDTLLQNAPGTTVPLLAFVSFKLTQWDEKHSD